VSIGRALKIRCLDHDSTLVHIARFSVWNEAEVGFVSVLAIAGIDGRIVAGFADTRFGFEALTRVRVAFSIRDVEHMPVWAHFAVDVIESYYRHRRLGQAQARLHVEIPSTRDGASL